MPCCFPLMFSICSVRSSPPWWTRRERSDPPVQMSSSPLHCRSPWQRRTVTSEPLLGDVKPGLQRTSSRAEKAGEGERRRTSEVSLTGRGQGHVRPEERRENETILKMSWIVSFKCTKNTNPFTKALMRLSN